MLKDGASSYIGSCLSFELPAFALQLRNTSLRFIFARSIHLRITQTQNIPQSTTMNEDIPRQLDQAKSYTSPLRKLTIIDRGIGGGAADTPLHT